MDSYKHSLLQKLDKIAQLSEGSKADRLLYNPLGYLKGQFYAKAVYPITKRGNITTSLTFFGREMQVLLPAGMDIYLLGAKTHPSEIRLAKLILQTVQDSDVFLDIGAHFGYFSLLASQIIGAEGKVLCIEASEETYNILKKNTAAAANTEVQHTACTDADTTLHFYEFPILYSEYNTLAPTQYENAAWLKGNKPRKIEVQGKKADSILAGLGISPDFIKIDVEGAEAMVISGLHQTLQRSKKLVLAMEYLHDDRVNSSHIAAAKMLYDLGYKAHVILESGNLKEISLGKIPEYIQSLGWESDNIVFQR